MIPELGHFSLILSLFVALVLGLLSLIGAHQGRRDWVVLARPATQALWLLTALAYGCLTYAFYSNDFSVVYVVQHSNSQLPDIYRIAGVWGGHEGSLLLWHFMLTSWMLAVSLFSRQLPDAMVARVLGVLGLVAVGFLVFMLFTSNPFLRLADAPADGRDLNPLLQDPGLVFHPPMLYMGYVGLAIPFAFAIAALLNGRLDAAWARWSRPWATAAWIFLTLGIALGSWWAYYELGWGGWWFWDPVENASFLPWLVSAALIHSLAVTEKRGLFRNWTIVLAITAFSLSLLGTFLVRSGVLTSVHAFATDPRRGVFILIFLCVVVGGSLTLFAMRAGKVRSGGTFTLMSRETFLLFNNVLLTTAAASVLLGTLYPLIVDALNLGKLSVGPPYFNAVFVPIMVPVLLFMVVGTAARWKSDDLMDLARKLGISALAALVLGCSLPLLAGPWSAPAALGLSLALWIVLSSLQQIYRQLRGTANWRATPWSFWGMHMAHIGIAVSVIGVTMVTSYETEKDVRMGLGDTVAVGGYTFRLTGIREAEGPNYRADVGDVQLMRDGQLLRTLHPEKRTYFSSAMPMTEAAIDTGLTRDVYVSLGERLEGGEHPAWAVRVYYKPFVSWIWGGGLLMALGGTLAALDRRYRSKRVRATAGAGIGGATA
ncbi:MAG TPA: heme lyase CcmF/NrfE family subunit [Alicycliphilus sp.]|jgi:cytochrome c-type biogenesis protein CcmF|uniref:Heme lyase CcmF/NrfE family subunit n=1 Tax=Diaphorobacter limosus TaxID=3036128 RepID=A0ABZ0J860_9BURK|nr:heme lyase CcmF/NrfE family subunit [Diaphorobacter sp. Y-1]MBP7324932.1 heme lyase CcmF/NrfE family subunit [Alicycliphilus sp.]MCA0440715.1 heme lyase CcmF/NrfE family subunit [Pseudomonadota bacterium]MBP7328310.1 heme lyase CcmF/NrfE family subunit [Alicycliphilus sp.]WOO33632.1 heme lyase CcmF/NrfE family subunit [Diaphorobacter sp. Y-1]HRN63590.1 heme lyase CcmF/NrfE family subunit [Alicycliphilus sp.]